MALEKLLSLFKEKKPEPVINPAESSESLSPAAVSESNQISPQPGAAVPHSDSTSASIEAAQPPPIENATAERSTDFGAPPDLDELRETIIRQIQTIFDPEIPVNIYDLGLIYEIHLNDAREALVRMTLTAPNCPSAEELPVQVDAKVRSIPGITGAQVELVWEPSWNKDMMSDVARLELGM